MSVIKRQDKKKVRMFRRGCGVNRRVRWLQGRRGGKDEGLGHTGGQLGRGAPIRETKTGVGSKPGRFKKVKDPRKGVGSQRAFIPEGSEQRSEDNLVAAMRVDSSGQRWAKVGKGIWSGQCDHPGRRG